MNAIPSFTAFPLPAFDSSDDDDVPIAQTLTSQSKSLSMLASLASQPSPSPSLRKKKAKKSLWHYNETVAEPTDISSKYWDADAPIERATKRRAKEKLSAIQEPYENDSGRCVTLYLLCVTLYLLCVQLQQSNKIICFNRFQWWRQCHFKCEHEENKNKLTN